MSKPSDWSDDDWTTLNGFRGLHVGLLEPKEYELFCRAVHEGWAHRRYQGTAGFLGLAKVELTMKAI